MYDTILFDLDGTVIQSYEGVSNGVLHALDRLGMPRPEAATLRLFLGPPLADSFKRFCGMDDDTARLALGLYREHYSARGWTEYSVYDGIPETLTELRKLDKKIALATSKPEKFAKQILEHCGLSKQFDLIAGATLDERRNEKADVIMYALNALHTDPAMSLMVGDRKFDVLGAKQCGIKSAGVLYGFGNRDELKEAGADYIIATAQELLGIV